MRQLGETATVVPGSRAGQPDVLASDADREAVAGQLSSAFAEGRLTASEHAERVQAAYRARTFGELSALTADLPPPPGVSGRAPLVPGGVDWYLLCVLICCPPAGIRELAARRRARARPNPWSAPAGMRRSDW